MEQITIKDAFKKALETRIDRPMKGGYFEWHYWRMQMVKSAMLMLAARIAARGHNVIVRDTYVLVDMNGNTGYIQYNDIEHTYWYCSTARNSLHYNGDMVITSSWKEIKYALEKSLSNHREPFEKWLQWAERFDDYIYIKAYGQEGKNS